MRGLGKNKLSIRLHKGVITHVGLVEKAAVAENNQQDFEALSGDFGTEFNAEALANGISADDNGLLDKVKDFVQSILGNQKKEKEMTNEEKLAQENAELKTKLQAQEKAQAMADETEKIKQLEAKVKDFEAKERATKKTALKEQVDATQLTDEQKSKAMEFADALLNVGKEADFTDWLKGMTGSQQKPTVVIQGSVTAGGADFSAQETPAKKAETALKAQYAGLK